MTRIATSARSWMALCLLASGAYATAGAQASRAATLDSARAMAEDFRERQSIELFQRALNPALGAPDTAWTGGVQMLAEILIRIGQQAEAVAWLRWALRIAPSMQVDSITFPPRLVSEFYAAREFVTRNRPDSLTRVRWEWSTATAAGGFGDLRVEIPEGVGPEGVQLLLDGQLVDLNRAQRKAPGSYKIAGRVTGAGTTEATTEVLPGVTTVVTLGLVPSVAVMTEATQRRVRANLVRIDAQRFGQWACASGFVTRGSGLVLTSYRWIRGAEALAIRLGDGQQVSDVRVAAYDVAADLAVLTLGRTTPDSLAIASGSPTTAWAANFRTCADSASIAKVALGTGGGNAIRLAEDVPSGDRGALLVTSAGAAFGLATAPRTATPLATSLPLISTAAGNVAASRVLTTNEVATREKHAMGEVALQSTQPNTRLRVTPLETWQGPEAARTDAAPFTFRGPMGRYSVEVLRGEEVIARREMTVEPSKRIQLAVGPQQKKKFPILPVLGGVAAGGLALMLAGGGGDPPPPSKGSISIVLPPP